jgi:hypothetical protein
MDEDLLEMREPLPAVLLRMGEAVQPVVNDRSANLRQRLLRDSFVLVALDLMREQILLLLLRELARAGLNVPFVLR